MKTSSYGKGRRIRRWVAGIAGGLILGGFAAFLLLENFADRLIEGQIHQRTGFPAKIEHQQVHLLGGLVDFENLRVYNPPPFAIPDFIHLKQLEVDAQVRSLIGDGRIVIEEAVVDLESLTIVRPPGEGRANLTQFVSKLLNQPPSQAHSRPYLIKKLTIRIGALQYYNLNADTRPITVPFSYQRRFENVTDVNQLWRPMILDFVRLGAKFLAVAIYDAIAADPAYTDVAAGIRSENGLFFPGGENVFENLGSAARNLVE